MDFAAQHTANAVNGLDIVLWLGFLYLVPRLLKLAPRKRVRARRAHATRPLLVDETALRIA